MGITDSKFRHKSFGLHLTSFAAGLTSLFFVAFGSVNAASYDCAKATRSIDKAICASPQVSKLDSDLGEAYKSAIAKGVNHEALKDSMNAWLRGTRDKCKDEACLVTVYREKIAFLAGLNVAPQGAAAKASFVPESKAATPAVSFKAIAGKGAYLYRIQCKNTLALRNPEPELCKDEQLKALSVKVDSYYATLESKQIYHFEVDNRNRLGMESKFNKEITSDFLKYYHGMEGCGNRQCLLELLDKKIGYLTNEILKIEPAYAAEKQRFEEDQEAIRISKEDSVVVLKKWANERAAEEARIIADKEVREKAANNARARDQDARLAIKKPPNGSSSTWSPPGGTLAGAGVGIASAMCELLGAAVMMVGDRAANGFDTAIVVDDVRTRVVGAGTTQFMGQYMMNQVNYMYMHSAYLAQAKKNGSLINVRNQVMSQCLGVS